VASQTSPLRPARGRHRLPLPRLVDGDLLPPALLAAEPLVTSIHVDILGRAELTPAQGAGLEEAARDGAVAPCGGGGSGARPDHLLEHYARRVRVRVPAVVVLAVHDDLEPDDEALALARAAAAAARAGAVVSTGAAHPHGRRDEVVTAAVAVDDATLLAEVEDALASWKHGCRRRRVESPHLR
jgi:hypothetical protein